MLNKQASIFCVATYTVSVSLCVLCLPWLWLWIADSPDHIHYTRDRDRDAQRCDINQAKCSYYSPSYPSAGGPGCSPKCTEIDGNKNSSYGAGFFNATHSWPKDLISNMHLAASVVKKYGTPNNLDTESSIYLHVTFDYYCCYTPEEGVKIGEFLKSYTWTPHEVWFEEMVCAVYGYGDMVAIVLMLNEDSQNRLLQWALDSERDLEARTGVHKRIPHTQLQAFHMTLATVNQSVFPVQPAVKEINRLIPRGTWHSTPIILLKPVCNKCDILMTTRRKGRY